jgi:predicted RNase H-like HicB family nuclease
VLHEIRAAIQFHLEGLASDGFVAPASSSSVEMVSV